MYENLINNYEIMFEGIPEPIFYGRYYPMGHKEGPQGEELWDLFNYGRGLKKDKDPFAELFKRFENEYETDLRALLNCVMQDTKGSKRGVVVIPSSKRGNTNRVTELVRRTLASNPGPFADLTGNFVRSQKKDAAHEGGDRSIAGNARTLEVRPRGALLQFGTILVVDDIVTSGNSFRAADEVLRAAGFKGTIVNFAFSRTFPSDGAMLCLEAKRDERHIIYATGDYLDEYWGNHPVDGFVLDLDQTLIEDPVRDPAYEGVLWRDSGRQSASGPYGVYEGVADILGLHLPTAVLSNRPMSEIEHIIEDSRINDSEYRYSAASIGWPVKPFSFPTERNGGYTIRYYKPSSRGVKEAVEYLTPICTPIAYGNSPRIIGVGNTKEDIFAYGEAGIGSALALWGVPDYLKDYAARNWGAAYVFSTPRDLVEWCGELGGFYEKAVFYDTEPRDEKRAIDYYGIAINCGDHVMEAAFRLAYLHADKDPERAIELYELAIESGDEHASTNNLALLIEEANPGRAQDLFERAIAAGNRDLATRNLALLIMQQSPDRAVELLRLAAQEGNATNLARDLEPLVLKGHVGAFELYRDLIVGSDDDWAMFAELLSTADAGLAKGLLEAAIADGDEKYATRFLAKAIMDDEHDRAIDLLARASRAGNSANLMEDLKPLILVGNERAIQLFEEEIIAGDPKRAFDLAVLVADNDRPLAETLYERAIAAGDEYASTGNLANVISSDDPERAKELYERAIAAGEERYATNNLANLIVGEDPDKTKELYERAIAAGDERYATNGLARLIASKEPAKAISLYERAIRAGDECFAPRNLATLIISADPSRAVGLFELAARSGNKGSLAVDLEPAIKNGNLEAVDLYEREIVAGDETRANDLANLIKANMPEKAEELYRRAIAAGDERHATFNLAALLEDSNPNESEALYERSISAGDTVWAPNNLGALIVSKDPSRARDLFQQALDAGDEVYAPCNLAHTYLPSDPAKAIDLYERSLKSGDETEAKIGLSYLLRDDHPERANDLAAQALAASNMKPSFDFLIEVVMAYDKEAAFEVSQHFIKIGYHDASETLIKLGLGDSFDPENEVVLFGIDIESGARIPWLVLGPADGGILLLSKYVICKKPFVDGAPEAKWEDSEVRRWLNESFVNRCFSSDEIDMAIARPDLGDKFFCLSVPEFEERLADENGIAAKVALDTDKHAATKWWLRSEEGGTLSAPCVDETGRQAWSFALVELGVRPAVILRLQ